MKEILKQYPLRTILSFDLEMASQVEELDPKSEMYKVFRYKKRDRETEKLPTQAETQKLWKREAALNPIFGQIVCASASIKIKEEGIYSKTFTGTEREVVEGITKVLEDHKGIIAGFNIVGFDLPYLRKRHAILGLSNFPPKLQDVGKKPWDMDNTILDIMKFWKGSSFYNDSLDELCLAFGVPSPKNGGIKGSGVSEEFHKNGVKNIEKYCQEDSESVINLIIKMLQ